MEEFNGIKKLLAMLTAGFYAPAPRKEPKKPKKIMGPGVGTNRVRRFREGKNW